MKEYKLKHPIVLGEETIETLKLDAPTRKDIERSPFNLRKIQEDSDMIEMFKMIEACCKNCTCAHIDRMDARDLAGAVETCAGFF
jgi:hypothetical protein